MKIVNTATGKAYHLDPETQLEVERTNPFFNEVGEQTLPVTLPDSDHNRAILGYPEALANKAKPSQDIDATIQDGEYFTASRQALLGAKRKEGIETSFYMNEGAFFGRFADMRLGRIFENEVVSGVDTVQQAINFCRSLLLDGHNVYAIFSVLTKGKDDEYPKWLNRLEYMNPSTGNYIINEGESSDSYTYFGFYNEFDRTETDGDYTISVPAGYHITPFIRANYVLRRMFAHLGYILEDTFFSQTYPFSDMVFINNTDDTLANGRIRLTDMIPDIMCSTLLNMYRKKFGCEFIPDELNKTVRIEFLQDTISEQAVTDLSSCVDGELELTFSGKYKQLSLSSKEVIKDGDQYDSVTELLSKFPDAYMYADSGCFYRRGISANIVGHVTDVTEMVATSAIPYMAEEKNEIESIEVPDCAIVMKNPKYPELANQKPAAGLPGFLYPTKKYYGGFPHPYIGETRALNSTVTYDNQDDNEDITKESATANNKEQAPMLAFVCRETGYSLGTITDYDPFYKKISDYSLLYNGPAGIFEKFYRTYDNILRNSMNTVRANLLLSQHQKMTIQAHRKVVINSQELAINKLAFTLGGKDEPKESEFYTLRLLEPVELAQLESERFSIYTGVINNPHTWSVFVDRVHVTQAEYDASPYKGTSIPIFYLPYPDPDKYNSGEVFIEKILVSTFVSSGTRRYWKTTLRIIFV